MMTDDIDNIDDLDDDSGETELIDNDAVRRAVAAINAVYEFSCVGGNLHIAVDDGNMDNGCLDFCADQIADNTVHEAGPDQLRAERECLAILRGLTYDERWSAYLSKSRVS